MPFIRVGGLSVHYEVAGAPDAPVLLLIHSLGTTLQLWDLQFAALAERFRVVRYDLRGHGLSEHSGQRWYAIDELAEDAAGVLEALQIRRASVVGISIGGLVAQRLAALFPQRVERLVLCATGARIGTPAMWDERIALVERAGMEAVVEGTLGRWFSARTIEGEPALVDRFRRMLSRTPLEGYVASCAALRDADARAGDAWIVAPTLVVAGADDVVTPPDTGAALRDAIPGAQLAVIEGAAHILNADRPAEFGALLDGFLVRDASVGPEA